jgi:penicillin G amidase
MMGSYFKVGRFRMINAFAVVLKLLSFRSINLLMTCGLLALAAPSCRGAEELAVPGLGVPVEILRDRWGVAHIYARNEHDLFFAQGFNVARDRLFQLELWRRQATGTMAETQGETALPRDVGARLLRFRGDITRELGRYHPRGAEIVGAFVEGINAFIAQTEQSPSRLPIEFKILGIKPGRWTPEVVVSRHNGLFRNVTNELRHAQLVRAMGADRVAELLNLHPGHPRLDPDPELDLTGMSDDVIKTYSASRAPVRFQPADVKPEYRGNAPLPGRQGVATPAKAASGDGSTEGSNNWVLSGEHTSTNAPILANDPHRAIQLPSLRYWVHLVAPGWNVIGAGEPALPGVSVGHNERGAWGFTIFPIDQEDLYVYETDPDDHSRYKYRGAWEAMRVERETIPVKGRAAVEVELKFTRHGPVLYEDRGRHLAYAIKAAWLEEGAAPYLASLRIDQASNWTEFREACRHFLTPSENLVWADVDGHIGWQAVGLAPIRANGNGLMPVPGDGRYEWNGYLPASELPYLADPPRGRFATANQDNLPGGYPFAVGYEWTDPFRFARIEEVLGSDRRFSLGDMERLQHDELSLPARSLVPLLRGKRPHTAEAKEAVERLLDWDFVLGRDSVPAAIYVAWERELRVSLLALMVPREARPALPENSPSTVKIIAWLTEPDSRFGSDPITGRNALVLEALDRAVAALRRHLGPDMSRWQYGQAKFKHIQLMHPLSDAVTAELQARLDLESLPRGGYAHTVNSTSNGANQATGASFRIIADVGDWDRSVGTNTPGQSGDPDSPHYRDLYKPWAAGEYFPASFSRAKVESVTEAKTVLVPRRD